MYIVILVEVSAQLVRIHIRRHYHPAPSYHPPIFLIQTQSALLMRRGGEIYVLLPVGSRVGNGDVNKTARDPASSVLR
jgi:hypothetical protein